jgi:hypothetical protein
MFNLNDIECEKCKAKRFKSDKVPQCDEMKTYFLLADLEEIQKQIYLGNIKIIKYLYC